jgi:hypothetical protein
MAEHIVQALEMTDSSLEAVSDGCARAIDLYPDKSEMELCKLLIDVRRSYEKFASDESKQAQSAEFFLGSGLWYQPDCWRRYLGSQLNLKSTGSTMNSPWRTSGTNLFRRYPTVGAVRMSSETRPRTQRSPSAKFRKF